MPDTVEMKDALVSQIKEFKGNPQLGAYDETRTKQGIVLGILSVLGWNVFNVDEVYPEYPVDGGRVDYSLRIMGTNYIFIEVKKPAEDLDNHKEQVLSYSFKHGVGIAILTNGETWKFYLPLEQGNWDQRGFYTIDISTQPEDDVSSKFIDFLSRQNVESGEAKRKAESLYHSRQRQNILKKTIPKAWQKIISEQDELLVELINDYTERLCGHKADEEMICQFLKDVQPPVISEIEPPKPPERPIGVPPTPPGAVIVLDPENPGDLRFTRVQGTIAGKHASKWNNLVRIGIISALEKGWSVRALNSLLPANVKDGTCTTDGYHPLPGFNVSVQNISADGACETLILLAKKLDCDLHLRVSWYGKSPRAGRQGELKWPS